MNTSLRVLSSWLDMLPIGGKNNQKVSDRERKKKKKKRKKKRERERERAKDKERKRY